ncbi:hypothetical protein AVEN_146409-1 [Araneus ventricosus]|uniref:Uncharacterized protein n=1 Tax=Araneus ventricosus TaxID=182803 RepID=A0A4Y2K1P5_ARAVE|nr:hypothetical protein AVEN_146409-1 [Araneus ventricosus]
MLQHKVASLELQCEKDRYLAKYCQKKQSGSTASDLFSPISRATAYRQFPSRPLTTLSINGHKPLGISCDLNFTESLRLRLSESESMHWCVSRNSGLVMFLPGSVQVLFAVWILTTVQVERARMYQHSENTIERYPR